MLKVRLLVAVSAFELLLGLLNAGNLDNYKLVQTVSGTQYECHFTKEAASRDRVWKEPDPVPLNPDKAISIAKDILKQAPLASPYWKLEHVQLVKIADEKWLYEITFIRPADYGISNAFERFRVPVSLGGDAATVKLTNEPSSPFPVEGTQK